MGPGDEGRVPGLWAPQRRALTTGLVLTITFVASEALAVVTVMPVVARDLGGLRLYGWVFSAFMLGSVVGHRGGRPGGRPAGSRGPVRGRRGAVRLPGWPWRAWPPRWACWWRAGCCRAWAPARCPRWPTSPSAGACPMRCGPDDGGPVDRLGRAGAGRAGDQRRGGAPVRLALGVPRPAAGGRGGRVHRRARADPARAARRGSGAGAPADRRPAHRGRGGHAAGRPQPRGRVRRDPGRASR